MQPLAAHVILPRILVGAYLHYPASLSDIEYLYILQATQATACGDPGVDGLQIPQQPYLSHALVLFDPCRHWVRIHGHQSDRGAALTSSPRCLCTRHGS